LRRCNFAPIISIVTLQHSCRSIAEKYMCRDKIFIGANKHPECSLPLGIEHTELW
jgi:hypothetical protein